MGLNNVSSVDVCMQPSVYRREFDQREYDKQSINNRKSEKQKAVERVQKEFINQVTNGKSYREAFFDSIKAMDKEVKAINAGKQFITLYFFYF